jgi:copper oxidase (laccase) domain-containing protein
MQIPKKNLIYSQDLDQGIFAVYSQKPDVAFYSVNQVHGHSVIIGNQDSEEKEADGIVYGIAHPKKALCIKTADCIPLLIEGEKDTAFLHCGWRSVEKKIYANETIHNLVPKFAFIGPCASVESYEVTSEFKKKFPHSQAFEEREQKLYFDLEKELRNKLLEYYPRCQVSSSGICTINDSLFHSYRRNKTKSRNWNVYFPRK